METKYTEIIDKYLSGELEGKELFEFTERLKTDKQLQHELKLEEELNSVITDEEVLKFRNDISEVRKSMLEETLVEEDPINQPKIVQLYNKNKQWYLIAASVIIILGLSIYLIFIADVTYTNEQLYAQYFEPYPAGVSIRSDDTSATNPITLGFTEYENSNFEEAAKYFQTVLANEETNTPVRFYLGISCMETGRLSDAEQNFKIVIDDKLDLFNEQAKWYLVLTLIKMDNEKYSLIINNLLNEIISENGDRKEDVFGLLEELEK